MAQGLTTSTLDPLAQTFFVQEPTGVYITKIGLFFKEKSSTLPITLQIRNTISNLPSNEILEKGVATVPAGSVLVSEDASAETVFEFDEPVYLAPSRFYAFVLKTNDGESYSVWASFIGDFNLGTQSSRVSKDTNGMIYQTTEAIQYLPEPIGDIKYRIYRARYAPSGTVTAAFINAKPPVVKADKIETTNGSSTVTVYKPSHGFLVNDNVVFQNLSVSSLNGIAKADIEGRRVVTKVDLTGFQFTAGANATSSGTSTADLEFRSQRIFNSAKLQVADIKPNNKATITYSGEFATSKSLASISEVAYQTSSISDIENGVLFNLDQPHVMLTPTNEDSDYNSDPSIKIIATLDRTVDNDYVSPSIDLQRMSLVTIRNLIDRQDSAGGSGFNQPISFVPETDPKFGSSAAKYISKEVTLEIPANGIFVRFSANRPIGSELEVYYRTLELGEDTNIRDKNWVYVEFEDQPPANQNANRFDEYTVRIGGEFFNELPTFSRYQIKIVMRSQSSSIIPRIRDLTTISYAAED